jgi:hypothetical protein
VRLSFRGYIHLHSYDASFDASDTTATPSNIIDIALDENLQIITLTDHNDISNVREAVGLGEKKEFLSFQASNFRRPRDISCARSAARAHVEVSGAFEANMPPNAG